MLLENFRINFISTFAVASSGFASSQSSFTVWIIPSFVRQTAPTSFSKIQDLSSTLYLVFAKESYD